MHDFRFVRPDGVAHAASLLQADDDARLLAGGQTLLPTLKQRLARPSTLIDLAGLGELRGINVEGDSIRIGAMTRHYDVATSPDVKRLIPALAHLAAGIGDAQVRYRGTIGGSVANNDPAADYPAGCLGLGATIHTDRRSIPADVFFVGLFETALRPGELVVSISFPIPRRAAYRKFRHPASRYALAGVFVARTENEVRVAVTGAGAGVFRMEAFERALASDWSAPTLEPIEVPAGSLNEDIHASQAYRAHLVKVLAQDAVQETVQDAVKDAAAPAGF